MVALINIINNLKKRIKVNSIIFIMFVLIFFKNEKEEKKETVLSTEASVKVADFAPSVTADDRPNSFK